MSRPAKTTVENERYEKYDTNRTPHRRTVCGGSLRRVLYERRAGIRLCAGRRLDRLRGDGPQRLGRPRPGAGSLHAHGRRPRAGRPRLHGGTAGRRPAVPSRRIDDRRIRRSTACRDPRHADRNRRLSRVVPDVGLQLYGHRRRIVRRDVRRRDRPSGKRPLGAFGTVLLALVCGAETRIHRLRSRSGRQPHPTVGPRRIVRLRNRPRPAKAAGPADRLDCGSHRSGLRKDGSSARLQTRAHGDPIPRQHDGHGHGAAQYPVDFAQERPLQRLLPGECGRRRVRNSGGRMDARPRGTFLHRCARARDRRPPRRQGESGIRRTGP